MLTAPGSQVPVHTAASKNTHYDTKENLNDIQQTNAGKAAPAGPLAFTSANQIQPNNADDDPADDESSIVSELKTPTSVVQSSYVTPTHSIVSHTLKKNQLHATLQLQNHPSLGPS